MKPLCSYWDMKSNGWSQVGCRLNNSTWNETFCECSHLTNFALLMTPIDVEIEACITVAVLLHYFYLVAFFLMLAEGVEFMSLFVRVYEDSKAERNTNIAISLAWGKCWLSVESGLIWAFVGPALFVIAINLVLFVAIMYKICHESSSRERKSKFKVKILSVVFILPLLGLTWIFGVLSVSKDLIAFQYIFAIANSLQGLFIFIIHGLRTRREKTKYDMKNSSSSNGKKGHNNKKSNARPPAKSNFRQDRLMSQSTATSSLSSGQPNSSTPSTSSEFGDYDLSPNNTYPKPPPRNNFDPTILQQTKSLPMPQSQPSYHENRGYLPDIAEENESINDAKNSVRGAAFDALATNYRIDDDDDESVSSSSAADSDNHHNIVTAIGDNQMKYRVLRTRDIKKMKNNQQEMMDVGKVVAQPPKPKKPVSRPRGSSHSNRPKLQLQSSTDSQVVKRLTSC
ncbi:hypothetical protein HELRODRAFT_178355 [Helobdella robusta]|uniref:G-protein coupled receptors family 2 profile 2 domain-containing protein n=1 Tax=Helobdella robusta TaxID=6412 RepID=T1FD34_HELRO|nr:hypothetical protein HELRODRAFT_178355 [Helobdella robusta]ESN97232.1 hypothetical protein HELRODRAFT_178355 [Helobdella robusta]